MATFRVTLEVDAAAMFDRLLATKGDTATLGFRLSSAMMTGEYSFVDAIGLSLYGVQITTIEKREDTSRPAGRQAPVRMTKPDDYATQEQIFAAHAEHGRLDKAGVKKAMGPNWPAAWDRAHPDIFEPGKDTKP